MRLANAVVARQFDVESPIEAPLLIVRRDVLQLGAIALAVRGIGAEGERQLQAELPVMPDAVGIFGHQPQRTRPRLVDVRLQRVRVVSRQLVGEHLDLVRRRPGEAGASGYEESECARHNVQSQYATASQIAMIAAAAR